MGFNAIQTYVPWNYHEMQRGVVDFADEKDLFAFLALAGELDMMVLLRPGSSASEARTTDFRASFYMRLCLLACF
jgi:beta-galactosidase GanA